MFSRVVSIAVLTVGALVSGLASTAVAGTWKDAAADPRIDFSVYRPTAELGLHPSVRPVPCSGDPSGRYEVVAQYRKAGSSASVTIHEASPDRCGDPGESLPVAHVMVDGQRVQVNVFCRAGGCPGGVSRADGFRQGFLLFVAKPGGDGTAGTDIAIMTQRVRLPAAVRLARSLTPITAPKGSSPPSGPRKIYFFASPFDLLSPANQLVMRPDGFPIFLDGQWVLERLHWKHWGSNVARARGISSSSDDSPDAASGKRIKTWARVTLSKPGPFRGHTVYRCIEVTVPPPADFGPRRCLKRRGKDAYLG